MNPSQRPDLRASPRTALGNTVTRLLSHSLIFYLLAVLAYKIWIVLNSDVGMLLKRAH